MKYLFLRFLLAATMTCAMHNAAAHVEAGPSVWSERYLAQNDRRSGVRISMGSAMEMVQRQTGGRVLNAQEVRQGEREGYRIKVLTRSGEVRVFYVDANTGAMQQD
jgi:uncharacterized membrane protein YkoI